MSKCQWNISAKCKWFILGLVLTSLVIFDAVFDYRERVQKFLSDTRGRGRSRYDYVLKFEPCKKIPAPPYGVTWPEEAFIHDPEITNLDDVANPVTSRAWFNRSKGLKVKLGDTVKVFIQLYDGRGQKKTRGGDLIRVWMRETSLQAASVGKVADIGNGSYLATLTAFWAGTPEVKVAIISPREVIAAQFRRRYICPPVLMNTGVFQHPAEADVIEETPCSYDGHVPGYESLCNFTEENYGRPWYCATPRHPRLMCEDWMRVADVNLWKEGQEQRHLSSFDQQLLSTRYSSQMLITNISLGVVTDDPSQTRLMASPVCSSHHSNLTWRPEAPIGYLYKRKWTPVYCRPNMTQERLSRCLHNTHIRLVGDSTLRQIFEEIQRTLSCTWVTESWSQGLKHRPAACVNPVMNFSLSLNLPPLPFSTRGAQRHYFKSFTAQMRSIPSDERTIVVLNSYAHLLNYHSHVFLETLKDMKRGIIQLLQRNPHARVVIKGPHAFSFSKSEDHVIWMPDTYADIYTKYIYDEFTDIGDRIVYLNALDITIVTEQWHIHADNFVVQELASQMFDFVCEA